MADRIEMLLRKNKFTAAICLLSDASQIAELRRRYGDHFYAKEDYDGALTQYAQTVGWIEPSYVIRQFLQVAQIRNLASYLEGLHKASLATAEHTTLLLSCYSQLKVSSSKVYDAFQTMLGSDTKQNRDISDILLRKCCDARTSSQEEAASVERGNCESRQIKQLKDCGDAALRTLVSNVTAITKLDDQAKSLTSPIVVLRTVAQTGDGNFSSVRDYVARALAEDSCAAPKKLQHRLKTQERHLKVPHSTYGIAANLAHLPEQPLQYLLADARPSGCAFSVSALVSRSLHTW
eukprot:CAMPEP_0198679910 /NCGR_PEP_ID=MMETSP1468-20131203/3617_1 /TAXON_ID=1461545 /ORGANISM="Mantoniella sp, Strain CCMP1436" /LENGTH=291 /DNA_ID=CAMNT_0044419265 /DNA_START=306 /DNA_END=1180 /DNA_ORIENTATION=-